MDGTALYEGIRTVTTITVNFIINCLLHLFVAVAALFMAQYYGVELTFGKIVAVRYEQTI